MIGKNIAVFVYDKELLTYKHTLTSHADMLIHNIQANEDFTLTEIPDSDRVWRWVGTEWVELLPINNPDIQYDEVSIWSDEVGAWVDNPELLAYKHVEDQEVVWEAIKAKRLEKVMNGVLVESVEKVFHTDSVSSIQYSTIAGMVALGTYEPIPWKVMDNSWVVLTVELLKELQIAMSVKTNKNYEVAEQHKAAMLLVDNPLEYDYSTNWV